MFQPKHVDNKVEYYPVKVYFGYLLRLYLFVRFKTTMVSLLLTGLSIRQYT